MAAPRILHQTKSFRISFKPDDERNKLGTVYVEAASKDVHGKPFWRLVFEGSKISYQAGYSPSDILIMAYNEVADEMPFGNQGLVATVAARDSAERRRTLADSLLLVMSRLKAGFRLPPEMPFDNRDGVAAAELTPADRSLLEKRLGCTTDASAMALVAVLLQTAANELSGDV